MNRIVSSTAVVVALLALGCQNSPEQRPASAEKSGTAAAVDLHNTVCPVEGGKVGKSTLTETYNGKVYHFCCDGCPEDFKKDPKKYADAVAADPAKYGVK